MKHLYLLLIPLLLTRAVHAQGQYDMKQAPLGTYTILSFSAGTVFSHHPGHGIMAAFPYTVTDVSSGAANSQSFNATLQNKFTSPLYMADLDMEVDLKHNIFYMGLGYFHEDGGDHGFYFKGGYGYILPVGDLLVKPSLNLYYFVSSNKLGSIDNNQKEISLLGYTAYDQFTVDEDDGNGGSYQETDDADRLDINYVRYSFVAEPGLVLSTKPMGRIVISLEAGYMFQLTQKCVLQLQQVNETTSDEYTVGKVALDRNGSMNGFHAGINIGIRVGR